MKEIEELLCFLEQHALSSNGEIVMVQRLSESETLDINKKFKTED